MSMPNLGYTAVDHGSFWLVKPLSLADMVPVLVDLADHPDQIATDTTDGFALRVPTHVFVRLAAYLVLVDGQVAAFSTPDAGNVETVQPETPAPKKRGRPRKNPLPEGG